MNAPLIPPSDLVPAEVIAQALRHPPSSPKVLPVLKRYLRDFNVSVYQIGELIRFDPGISARVLQIANSAAFSRGARCNSVELAVNRIGFDSIFEIVANAVAEQVLVRPLASYALDADEFWRRSVTCGLAAECLADLQGSDRNVAYTLGLMHGVGMVAIDQWVQKFAPTFGFFGRGFPRDHTDGERALLGCTNAEVGAAVLHGWEFPPEMAEPLRWQYAPLDSAAFREMNCLLYASKWICARICAENPESIRAPDDRFLRPLKLSGATLSKQIVIVRSRMDEVQRSLEDHQPREAA